MIESGFLTGFSIIFRLLELFLKKIKKDSMREELALILEIPIIKTEASYEKFNRSLYEYFGAGILGNVMEPSDPKETAQKIVDNIEESFTEFLHNFKNLTKYLDAHLDELRVVLSSKEIMVLEALIKSFENDVPDFGFLMNHGAMKSNVSKEMKRKKTFNKELAERLKKKIKKNVNLVVLSNTIQTPQIDAKQLVAETMTRIIMEKQFDLSKIC